MSWLRRRWLPLAALVVAAGMMSVNATTGAVWYHSWHGRFIAMDDHDTG